MSAHMLQDVRLHAAISLTNELTLLKATLILGARKRLIFDAYVATKGIVAR